MLEGLIDSHLGRSSTAPLSLQSYLLLLYIYLFMSLHLYWWERMYNKVLLLSSLCFLLAAGFKNAKQGDTIRKNMENQIHTIGNV